MQRVWPERVTRQLGRSPAVGDWICPCCINDLQQIETEDQLSEIFELIDDEYAGEQFYPSLASALDDIKSDSAGWNESERALFSRLGAMV